MIRSLLLSLLLFLGGCAAANKAPATALGAEMRAPVTILVSIDGLHPDHLFRGASLNLDRLAASGVKAEMRPSFPTKTFPNHYTIVTGLRPDRHGIVDNNMEDARRPGVRFSLGSNQAFDRFWWDEAEPLWVTAERKGIRTATMFWPGSEVAIRGTRPSDWQRFDENVTNRQRIDTVIDWFRRPEAQRPRFVTLYFDTVDTSGHDHGPFAAATLGAVREVDAKIGELQAALAAMRQPVNLVITSDHGMAATDAARIVRVDRMLDPASIRVIGDGAFLTVEPQAGREREAEAALLKPHDNMECWRKADIPPRYLYGRHARVPSIFCLARTGWLIFARDPGKVKGGNHGYDNLAPEMKATFIASGPAFRAGLSLPSFDNVHVYPLLARLAGVAPQPSDGDPAVLAPALR